MKTVYVNSLINLFEKSKSNFKITEFNKDYVKVNDKKVYFSKSDENTYFSLKEDKNSIFIEFRSSDIFIDAKILGIEPNSINYKTIIPTVDPQNKENLKIILILLLTENTDKINRNEFIKKLVKIHSHSNVDNDALANLFEEIMKTFEKQLKSKKSKILFTDKEIEIKYSLKDIDKMVIPSLKNDSMKFFEEI
jgi:hypothetical protein